MDKQQYQHIQNYREHKQLFMQLELESEIRELTWKIERYQVTELTVPSILLQELEPLQHRISLLIQQLKNTI